MGRGVCMVLTSSEKSIEKSMEVLSRLMMGCEGITKALRGDTIAM